MGEFIRHLQGRREQSFKVLDAGCGAGEDLASFWAAGIPAEGFDSDPTALERARARCPKAHLWQGDLRLLSLPRESYAGVWAKQVMCHLSPPENQRALASFFSLLRPRGLLFLSLEQRLESDEQGFGVPVASSPPLYRYTLDEYLPLLRQSGFQTILTGREVSRPRPIGFLARRL